jgi:protein SCO1/2
LTRRIAALAIAVVLCAANGRSAQAHPLADTVLVDQRGTPFTLRDLRGKPTVVTFIATRCTDACPVADAVFAQLARRHENTQLVTITLDPQHDTPFVMSRHARGLQARAPQWRMASGAPSDVLTFLKAFGVTHIGVAVHSSAIYLIDAQGRLARILPVSTGAANEVHGWLTARM